MTITGYLLAGLVLVLVVLVVAALVPHEPLNQPDPLEDELDRVQEDSPHRGRHRSTDDEDTTYLGDSLIRPPWS